MPHLNGFEACLALKRHAATRSCRLCWLRRCRTRKTGFAASDAGADDRSRSHSNAHELRARVRSLIRIKRYTDDLDSANRHPQPCAHHRGTRSVHRRSLPAAGGVCINARAAPRSAEEDITALARGGFLHDIGKVGVPDAVP